MSKNIIIQVPMFPKNDGAVDFFNSFNIAKIYDSITFECQEVKEFSPDFFIELAKASYDNGVDSILFSGVNEKFENKIVPKFYSSPNLPHVKVQLGETFFNKSIYCLIKFC